MQFQIFPHVISQFYKNNHLNLKQIYSSPQHNKKKNEFFERAGLQFLIG